MKVLVLKSLESPDGGRCVDVFQRPDQSFGFEEYRRDPEDTSGWHAVADFARQRFDDAGAAEDAARAVVTWLDA